jgi:hypothetical protein
LPGLFYWPQKSAKKDKVVCPQMARIDANFKIRNAENKFVSAFFSSAYGFSRSFLLSSLKIGEIRVELFCLLAAKRRKEHKDCLSADFTN